MIENLTEAQLMKLFGVKPSVFRNTELTFSNALAESVAEFGHYKAMLCEGVERYLGYRSPNYIYVPPRLEQRANAAGEDLGQWLGMVEWKIMEIT